MNRTEYAAFLEKESPAQAEALLGSWDDGYLQGMSELAWIVYSGLLCSTTERLEVGMFLQTLGEAFRWEIIGRGDIVPWEFEGCWRDALAEVGAKWPEPAEKEEAQDAR